jgi:hypothetical protein
MDGAPAEFATPDRVLVPNGMMSPALRLVGAVTTDMLRSLPPDRPCLLRHSYLS